MEKLWKERILPSFVETELDNVYTEYSLFTIMVKLHGIDRMALIYPPSSNLHVNPTQADIETNTCK